MGGCFDPGMYNGRQRRGRMLWWTTALFSSLLCVAELVLAQTRYSIQEEVKEGSPVGNIAKDLGLDASALVTRRFRIVSGSNDDLFQVNPNNGVLYTNKRIDREDECSGDGACVINLKTVIENPLEIHYISVEITDVNDNAPSFPENNVHLEIPENTQPGARFELQSARDLDAGINSVRLYKLRQNEHFQLQLKDSEDEDKILFLVLDRSLDREKSAQHVLLVTASDGGNPPKSGTLNITVTVLDTNDNRPAFSLEVYSVTLRENAPIGTIVTTVNATDADEGLNGEVEYSLGRSLKSKTNNPFGLDSVTGEVVVRGQVDFEENEVYRLNVQATDKGTPPMTVDCRVIIRIQDLNDNKPEIEITSLSSAVSESSRPGTAISLISVTDKDSGLNGKVSCSLPDSLPFELKHSGQENLYSVVTKSLLDREVLSHYDITVTATDLGQPPLSARRTFSVKITDINDNSPEFSRNPLYLYVAENNAPGASVFSVSASDKDLDENALISYHLVRGQQNDWSSFLNINSENGNIYALKSFDFETVKSFRFHVVAKDSGAPSLSSNVTVEVFIYDQNDNAPVILYPTNSNGSSEATEEIPRNVNAGHLVAKVRAYDPDVGYNGWLLFSLQEISDHTLFGLDRYTGQIRMLRSFSETDEAVHKLVILVKDNGNVSLSATATLTIKAVEPKEAFAADAKSTVAQEEESNITFYLIVTLASVSALFLLSVIVLIAMQCSKSADPPSKYLQDSSYDGTLCHSIQYRSGDKRYMLVGPRMSIGSAIVPGSNGNTLVVPDRRLRPPGEDCVYPGWILQHRASQAHSHTGMHADG
ncbi:protocadherin alpha-3-like isoform X2 [Denticeps clupeoides]|uniref:protocadherin alpha-3-like isoform X2 n=1 Tax=Denticeps clupeoides TaxID=299321 RepID=UPI0010A2FF2A|nr:protocadherin alpha-3-like isoform X2 [Denticeps clupeoides]